MSRVVYNGTSDFQEFGPEDFVKAGIDDQEGVRFARGEATEVSAAAAKALLDSEGLFGDFSFGKPKADSDELDNMDIKQLRKEIDTRNEELDEEEHISKAGSTEELRDRLRALNGDVGSEEDADLGVQAAAGNLAAGATTQGTASGDAAGNVSRGSTGAGVSTRGKST